MADNSGSKPSTLQLITVPALITLAVTVLRLVGERQGWSKVLFNPGAGGGFAPIGIVWLVPIFGIYFAVKLVNSGDGPSQSAGKVALMAGVGLAVTFVGFFVSILVSTPGMPLSQGISGIACIIAIYLQRKAWPSLFRALLAYGFAARIPVVIIMFFAIKGNWGTHYDGPPPGFPADMAWFPKFILIGVIPQLFAWIAFTVVIGTLVGSIGAVVTRRNRQANATA